MKIVIVSSEFSNSKSRFTSTVVEWAKDRALDVVFVGTEEAESFNGLTADLFIVDELIPEPIYWSEPLSVSKKGPNKPYYRRKERW